MKFNVSLKGLNKTQNHEGAVAYTLTPEMELYTAVVTASLSDKFYETDQERINRIRDLIAKVDPLFVAKLAVYTREKMYLRSIPLILAVELAKIHTGDNTISRLVSRVVQRADEITELLAYYQLANERKGIKKLGKLSKQIQKGLAISFNQFDAYQFAKYNRDAEIKLRDALFLVHPKAKDEAQQAIFNQIVDSTLETPYTWETELSALGQQHFASPALKDQAVREKWEELIGSGKLGYMALMRNLRNILEAKVHGDFIEKVVKTLTDEKAVAKSKQLPFRYLAAYREIKKMKGGHVNSILRALQRAAMLASANIRGFDYNTHVVLACDVSGSMQRPVSPRSAIMSFDIGLMLAMMLQRKCKQSQVGMFGDTWKVISVPSSNILANVDEFYKREGEVGYSTNGYLVIEDLVKRKVVADKVMIFTDCQMWDSRAGRRNAFAEMWHKYKSDVAPNAKIYLFDLSGYGATPLNVVEKDVYLIAGWSDKVFDVLHAIENGSNATDEIKKMTI